MDIKADLETLKAMSKYFRDSAFIPWADALDRAIQFIEDATAMHDEAWEIGFPDDERQLARTDDGRWNAIRIGVSTTAFPTATEAWKSLKEK
jgi:hypothetical protein